MSACSPPFSLQGFPTLAFHIYSYRCARNFDIVKLKFLLPLCLTNLLRIYLHLFRYHFSHILKKTAIHSLVCLLKSFTLDHWCTFIIQTSVNSLTISLTEWPENQKNRCLSFSANSVGLHFRDRVEKIEENGKKRKQKTYKMGRKNMAGKNSRTFTFGAKLQKHFNFFKVQFEIAFYGYLDKFLT